MIFFPDVNVWIALVSDRHVHNRAANRWIDNLSDDQLAFCRLTELGLIRLVMNRHVMGEDVMDAGRAWNVYYALRADPRIAFFTEQSSFDSLWQRWAGQLRSGSNALTDAYLAVFALHIGATIVTFDRGFSAIRSCKVLTLSV